MTDSNSAPAVQRLTPREKDCLRLVAQHLSSKQIARELSVSQHTVDGHINEARRKLGAATRREAVRILLEAEGAPSPYNRGEEPGQTHPPPSGPTLAPPEKQGDQALSVVPPPPVSLDPSNTDEGDDIDRGRSGITTSTGEVRPLPTISGERRYELTPPQRLAAIVVIAAVSGLVLLLLLLGGQALTQAFEGLVAP